MVSRAAGTCGRWCEQCGHRTKDATLALLKAFSQPRTHNLNCCRIQMLEWLRSVSLVQLAINAGWYHTSGSRQPALAVDGWKDGRSWHTSKPPPSCSNPLHLHHDLLTPAESRAVIKGQNYPVGQSKGTFPFVEGHGGFRKRWKFKDD